MRISSYPIFMTQCQILFCACGLVRLRLEAWPEPPFRLLHRHLLMCQRSGPVDSFKVFTSHIMHRHYPAWCARDVHTRAFSLHHPGHSAQQSLGSANTCRAHCALFPPADCIHQGSNKAQYLYGKLFDNYKG